MSNLMVVSHPGNLDTILQVRKNEIQGLTFNTFGIFFMYLYAELWMHVQNY